MKKELETIMNDLSEIKNMLKTIDERITRLEAPKDAINTLGSFYDAQTSKRLTGVIMRKIPRIAKDFDGKAGKIKNPVKNVPLITSRVIKNPK